MADEESALGAVARAVQAGTATSTELVAAFLDATLLAPSSANPASDGFTPVLIDIDGAAHMVVAASTTGLSPTASIAPGPSA